MLSDAEELELLLPAIRWNARPSQWWQTSRCSWY